MVWFYGGGYETGASSDLAPEMVVSRFVSEGVVFVTFNYRLNFYGPLAWPLSAFEWLTVRIPV